MNKIKTKNSIISIIIDYLEDSFKDNIISVYGIGSYFDKTLPSDWKITDIDVIVIVNSFDKIPKHEWTEVRYETKNIKNSKVWLGYNTLQGLKKKNEFTHESFANYEWSVLDLKCPENSQLLYGNDIRSQLPKISDLIYDFDDIFTRSLYHLNKSLKETNSSEKSLISKREFTKAVFKFGFYLCKYFDKSYYLTSVLNTSTHIANLQIDNKIKKNIQYFIKESKIFRRTDKFSTNFKILRKNFIFFIFSLLRNGSLHRKLEFQELVNYLEKKFNGLPYLTRYIKIAKKIYDSSKIL
ncbi:MAG: hypothetical protein KGD70_00185 [Candidatus Lokiarchaeota archaeon]|nr:hypothetical protein [Candidatus Lokiarchaeota archaeon]